MRAGLLNTGVFRIYADKTWVVFYRLAPDYSLAQVLRRDCRSGVDLGGCRKARPSKFACALPGGRWGLEMGGCGHPPLRGYDGGPAPGGHTGPPLQTLSCRGRRPRRPASTARAAPAERERKGIRYLPGDFLRTPTRGQGDFQPPKVRRVPVGGCFTWWHTFGRPPF